MCVDLSHLNPYVKRERYPTTTPAQAIDELSVRNGRGALLKQKKRALNVHETVELSYNNHAWTLPEITIGAHVALQNRETKRWDIYGTVTTIGPQRRYFVKTQSGRVLVRNRRFLGRCVPISATSVSCGIRPVTHRGSYHAEALLVPIKNLNDSLRKWTPLASKSSIPLTWKLPQGEM